MHRPDNDASDAEIPLRRQLDQTAGSKSESTAESSNSPEPKPFTVTCDQCGAWTPADEFEDELKCCRCGASIGQDTDVVVNFRPSMTPATRMLGRVILTVLAIMVLVTAWLLLSHRTP